MEHHNKQHKITNNLLSNNHGVLLLMVILFTIIMSLVAIGIMSVNVSQVKSSQYVIDSIKAEQLAEGIFYRCRETLISGGTCPSSYSTETLNGKSFEPSISITNPAGAPNDTSQVDVTITY